MRLHTFCAHGIALAALLCGLLGSCVVAADDGAQPALDPAIPPGEEEVIANMLGRGVPIYGCTFTGGNVEYTIIKATYDCPGGQVALQLDHPRNATTTSTPTGQFAITVLSGSPPQDFGNALLALVRSREGNFQWGWQESGGPTDDNPDGGAGAE